MTQITQAIRVTSASTLVLGTAADDAWRAAYNRLRERGTARKAALIALSRKAVRVLFAMVRDNAFYSSPVMEENLKVAA